MIKKQINKRTLKENVSDIVSMSYACTAFSMGTTFLMWYFINGFNLSTWIASSGLLVAISLVYLGSMIAMNIKLASSRGEVGFGFIACMYVMISASFGFCLATISDIYLLMCGSNLVLAAIGISLAMFIIAAVMGHRSEMSMLERRSIINAMWMLVMGLVIASLVIYFLMPAHMEAFDLAFAYLTVPVVLFLIYSNARDIKDFAERSIDIPVAEGESEVLKDAKISLICSILMFINFGSLLLKMLRILAAHNRRK
ncbi:MAG: Bax inhibitor-1/YccA family protein [Chlamydiia bacterium]|nr:Bax inhibitor-1/YccA family protein [Chlamydiia bacterium]